jgi:ERCC4-type nuclease
MSNNSIKIDTDIITNQKTNIFTKETKAKKKKYKEENWSLEIDSRETIGHDEERTDEFPLEIKKKQLLVGDFQILKNKVSIILIERKTILDLISSVSDGRYSEQKSRLLSSPAIHKGYIIEGNASTNIVRQKLLRMQLKENIKCFITKSKDDTLDFLLMLTKKMMMDPKLYEIKPTGVIMSGGNELSENYTQTLHLSKKKNLTPFRCLEIQIAQFPGISIKTAQCIAKKYKTWRLLIDAIENQSPIEFLESLDNTHRINKKTIETLQAYIHPS